MDLFTYLYLACLSGTVVSGTVTVFLFLRLDIRTALRVLGKRGKPKKAATIKRSPKEAFAGTWGAKEEQKTVLLHDKQNHFHVVREILLVHTDETL